MPEADPPLAGLPPTFFNVPGELARYRDEGYIKLSGSPSITAQEDKFIMYTGRRVLKGLTKAAFQHPADKLMMQELAEYKPLKELCDRFLTEGLEEDFYLRCLADNVKVSSNQGAQLWQMLQDASSILDMETPALFLDTNPLPNAWAFGERKPVIILTSGLIELLNDEEIFAVLGHELGHIKCGHTLYRLIAENLAVSTHLLSGGIPILGTVLSIGLQVYLLTWYRRSELSADRCALLTTQNEKIVLNTILKLAGSGGTRFTSTLDSNEFQKQAEEFRERQEAILKQKGFVSKYTYIFGTLFQTLRMTHPWLVVRAKEINSFVRSNRYQKILAGNYEAKEVGDVEYLMAGTFNLDLGLGDKYEEVKGGFKKVVSVFGALIKHNRDKEKDQ